MQPVLRLIRYKNLLIIALTMVLMRYGIIQPILIAYGLSLELSLFSFILIVFAIVLVAMGGYVINDYYDVKIDLVNKPDKVVVDRNISRKIILKYYLYLNIIAVLIALYVLVETNIISMFFMFPLAIGALWFYSTTYKKQGIVGNIIIGILSALVPIIPALFEIPLVNFKYQDYLAESGLNLKIILAWTGAFSLFAFLLTLAREVIKDCEDIRGDRSENRKTIPILFGEVFTKMIINIVLLLVIFLITFLFWKYLRISNNGTFDYFTFFYFVLLIGVPLVYTGGLIFKANKQEHYHLASALLKIIMLVGICFAFVVRFKIL